MKKTKLITAVIGTCLIASLLAGCNNTNGSTGETAQASRIEGGQTQISVEASEITNQAPASKYTFTHNGFAIVPGTDAKPVLDSLGEPEDAPYQGASCAGQGLDTIYEYAGFTLYTHALNDDEYITGVEIENSLTDCGGLFVGDSISKAKEIYGEPMTQDDYGISYSDGSTELDIITDGIDTIVLIRYREAVN